MLGWTGAIIQNTDGTSTPAQVPMIFQSEQEANDQSVPDKNDSQTGEVFPIHLSWEE